MRCLACWALVLVSLTAGTAAGWGAEQTVSGTVVGPDGRPVAGAQVLVFQFYTEEPATAVTSQEGSFALTVETMGGLLRRSVLAYHPGLAMAAAEFAGAPVRLVLGGGPQACRGLVRDPAGRPVAGAEVAVSALSAPGQESALTGYQQWYCLFRFAKPLPRFTVRTDAEGRFAFPDVAPDCSLETEVAAPGFASTTARVLAGAETTVALRPEATISGRVTCDGEPVAGVPVTAWVRGATGVSRATTSSGPEGSYVLRGLPGGSAQLAAAPGPPYCRPARQEERATQEGDRVTGVDFALARGVLLSGRTLAQASREPVARADVFAEGVSRGALTDSVKSDASGRYALYLPPGKYLLRTKVSNAGRPELEPTAVTMLAGEPQEGCDLPVRMPRRVRLQVLLPDGRPAEQALVGFSGWQSSLEHRTGPDGVAVLTMPAVPQNRYVTPEPPYGGPVVWARLPESNLCLLAPLVEGSDEMTMTLAPGASALTHVRSERGQPLAGARIAALGPLRENDAHGQVTLTEAWSDGQGLVRLPALPVGRPIRFGVCAPGADLIVGNDWLPYPQAGRAAGTVLAAGQELVLPDLVLRPEGRVLDLRVTDPNGQPVANAEVRPLQGRAALTDATGLAHLTRLPVEHPALLSVVHPVQPWCAVLRVPLDAPARLAVTVFPLATAAGTLVDGQQRPSPGWEVSCVEIAGNASFSPEAAARLGLSYNRNPAPTTTDAAGRWQLRGLLPGAEYRVRVQGPGEAPRAVGAFRATGGAASQEVGTMPEARPAAP